jgi:glycosyltransferase involved in cell wall biosynthesis
MKPIVAISYAYPPLKWPRAVQVHRLLHGLAERGHPITLFRAEPASAFGAIDASMDLLEGHAGIKMVMVNAYYRNTAVRLAYKAMPWLKTFPDEFNAWILPAYFAVSRFLSRASRDAVVCSFSNPWSDHIVGSWLHRRFGLPWIAHFSDPWAANPYAVWAGRTRRWHERMEAKVVNMTCNLVFVSEETKSLFVKSHGEAIASKSHVIPHIMAPELARMKSGQKDDGRLTLTYTGEFYGARSPLPIFKALAAIRDRHPEAFGDFRIRLVGAILPEHARIAKEPGLRDAVELVSPVPYRESLQYIVDADVLLLVDAKSEGASVFLPSKLVEYLGSGNPILGLTPSQGTSAQVIREMNGIVVEPDDSEGIARAFLDLLDKHRRGILKREHGYPARITAKYSAQAAAERFSDLVNAQT